MVLLQGGDLPFWITSQERLDTKFSQYDEMQLKDKKNAELISNIESADVDISVFKGNRVGDLQDIYCKKYISVKKIIRKEREK